ncbi:single stranded DNA-binding protein [Staphylococcus phage SA46-CTH2]|uniref:Single stranded DNA-binding protein n=1 Tax=Staphylococcus phage SA46-CL1 TaxID=2591106 RepID=A0A6M2YDK5_9CAUD|nr:single stranded DNA-binding protein [Staphylococcus phage SA46-CL1]QCW21988.1 single stranded DNA-binding protein [Staphylococcus phage SA46-CTH2]QDH84823.1 single stranded DNA-binding protein [Staphylococcus phage SA46-CL1]QEM41186.1 single stranded DNA-binding protein [Staphylococcus phage SA44-CTH7]
MTNVKEILSRHQNTLARFEFEEKEREFIKLSELVEKFGIKQEYIVRALFTNKESKFGEQGVIVTDDYNVNLPNHLTELIKDMRQDEDVVDIINKGEVVFTIYEYENKKGQKGYSINFGQVSF